MMYRLFLLIFLSPGCLPVAGQNTIGLPDIINYGKEVYNAGAQSWDIKQDKSGILYFANNEGLLSFDGTSWKLYPLPNKTIVRSIAFGKDNRIYVGAQDEIGYFSPDAKGKLIYTSLTSLLPDADKKFADIWHIVYHEGDLFFRSSTRILQYSNSKMKIYRSPSAWLYIGIHNGRLIAQGQDEGILVFNAGNWEPFIDQLPESFYMTSCTEFGTDTSLVTTQKNGVFLMAGQEMTPLTLTGSDINPYQNFTGSSRIDDETFVVGTYLNGCYILDRRGTVIQNFSRKAGLQNNNIRSLFSDKNRNIWLGLDRGIDFIAFNNAVKHINPANLDDGTGYSSVIFNNHLYIGLSNRIYQLPLSQVKDFSYITTEFKAVANSEGQTWNLSIVNNNLLAGAHEGMLHIKDNVATPVMKEAGLGFWMFEPLENIHPSSLVVAGNYHGIYMLSYSDNKFAPKGPLPNFSESSRFIAIDNNNIVWASHPYRGVYRISQSGAIKLYTGANGLPSSLNNHLYKIKNRIVVATEKGIYEYNSQKDVFEASAYFRGIFGESGIRYLKDDPNGNIWFIRDKNLGVVDFSEVTPKTIYMPELNGKMMSGFEHIYPVNDNNVFVGSERGFYHINFEKYKKNNHDFHVYVRTVKAIGKTDSLLFDGYFGEINDSMQQPDKAIPNVNHQWNSFHLEYAAPLFEQQSNIEYSYMLKGFDKDWSDWSKKTEKDYTNLSAGKYTFYVKARNNLGNECPAADYTFIVLPPWYQSGWAYLLYFVLACVLVYLVYRRQQNKFKLQQHLHQLELEKSDKEIVKLRNEKLESEIEFKNSELAATAMHLVQKGEFLTKIKEELQRLNKSGKDKEELDEVKKLLRTLSDEEKMDNDWEQFAVHFNKVHSDFLIKLKEKFPNLGAHELKLCAYLRMNLSSKEIAQLMNISVRGVEISRYRLRKKLQIQTETNLFQFLMDIHLKEDKS
jgi:ligand-binding sensor domain-containing protein/DNA-binding CsgD family transcriptional regulator